MRNIKMVKINNKVIDIKSLEERKVLLENYDRLKSAIFLNLIILFFYSFIFNNLFALFIFIFVLFCNIYHLQLIDELKGET